MKKCARLIPVAYSQVNKGFYAVYRIPLLHIIKPFPPQVHRQGSALQALWFKEIFFKLHSPIK